MVVDDRHVPNNKRSDLLVGAPFAERPVLDVPSHKVRHVEVPLFLGEIVRQEVAVVPLFYVQIGQPLTKRANQLGWVFAAAGIDCDDQMTQPGRVVMVRDPLRQYVVVIFGQQAQA